MKNRPIMLTALWALAALPAGAHAQEAYDLSSITTLCSGAVLGINVTFPVRGFEMLILKDGKRVYHQPFGQWSIGRIAAADSATKTISGAVIMSLVDAPIAGQPFSLDTRLSEYIPEFSGGKQNITIRQCFSHTSGLRSSDVVGSSTLTLQQAALDIADDILQFAPGSTFSYGGTSMHAAGAVAEVAAGVPWNSLFAASLAGPLGFANTRYVLSSPTNPRIAGGCESTAAEFVSFMEMLRQGGLAANGTRILSTGAVQAMFTRQSPVGVPIANTPLPGSSDYGVGVWLDQRDEAGQLTGAIAAGARGFSCWIDFDDGLVGCFATDLSTSGNLLDLLYLIRAATEHAVRSPIRCPGDYNRNGATTTQDIFDFLTGYFAGDLRADLDNSGSISVQDIFDYLAAYFGGCQ